MQEHGAYWVCMVSKRVAITFGLLLDTFATVHNGECRLIHSLGNGNRRANGDGRAVRTQGDGRAARTRIEVQQD